MATNEKQDEIREIWAAEFERRERLKKYYRNLLLHAFGIVFFIFVMVLFGKEMLVVGLIGLAIGLIGVIGNIAGIIGNR